MKFTQLNMTSKLNNGVSSNLKSVHWIFILIVEEISRAMFS